MARNGLTRLKRYQIDRIFHAGPKRSATEAWEADFDIIASGAGTGVSANGTAILGFPGALDDARGGVLGGGAEGQGSGPFEVAEAEAVLVVAQVRLDFLVAVGGERQLHICAVDAGKVSTGAVPLCCATYHAARNSFRQRVPVKHYEESSRVFFLRVSKQ